MKEEVQLGRGVGDRLHRRAERDLAAAGHWPHEEQPEVCVESVRRFLSQR